jgi:hypothetical protein
MYIVIVNICGMNFIMLLAENLGDLFQIGLHNGPVRTLQSNICISLYIMHGSLILLSLTLHIRMTRCGGKQILSVINERLF